MYVHYIKNRKKREEKKKVDKYKSTGLSSIIIKPMGLILISTIYHL